MPDSEERGPSQQHGFVLSVPAGSTDTGPLVVLLGWVGCQDRHLAKFSAFLNAAGYATVRAIMPTAAVFFPTAQPRVRWTEALLAFLERCDPGRSRPLVLWAFSNGGAFPLSIMSRLSRGGGRQAHLRERVAGVIFDSAPCYMHGTVGAQALGEGRPLPLRALLAAVFLLVMALMLLTDPRAPQRFWGEMLGLGLGRSTLYLYSADDHLCDAGKLEELIAARRAAGAAVEAHRWEVSRHVAHYRHHPRQYEQLVLGFLRALAQEGPAAAAAAAGAVQRGQQLAAAPK